MSKHRNKLEAIFLTVVINFCSSGSAFAASVSGGRIAAVEVQLESISVLQNVAQVSVAALEPVYGLDEAPSYFLATLKGTGFAILTADTLTVIEANFQGASPYPQEQQTKYYGSPLNYLKKSDGAFVDLKQNKTVSEQECREVTAAMKTVENKIAQASKNAIQTRAPMSYTVSYGNYIANSVPIPDNIDGICGSVAASMMLTALDITPCAAELTVFLQQRE